MSIIHVLDETTINKIAAGEVVERPSAVVKELIENSVDSGATAITVEIKEGGLSLIRITDNGSGIEKDDIPLAFLRHATSKIRTAEDLLSVTSLGFRGEALSSVSSVSQVELITKTAPALSGYRYLIEGGIEKSFEEIGCPSGTTILVRNLFYNTPARRNFLKSPATEAGYVSDLMERLMVSHPSISFKYIVNNQVKLQSSGNNNSKDILYQIYGRDIAKQLLSINYDSEDIKITGFIGKPVITRGNRNFENYFINGRYIKSNIIAKAIEEAYRPFLMQHKYPFTTLYFNITPSLIDVNVHPQKMEIRLKNSEEMYSVIINILRGALTAKELIPKVTLTEKKEEKKESTKLPEPFEENRRKSNDFLQSNKIEVKEEPNNIIKTELLNNDTNEILNKDNTELINNYVNSNVRSEILNEDNIYHTKQVVTNEKSLKTQTTLDQLNLFHPSEENSTPFISKKAFEDHRIIGQVFSTYWLVEYKNELFIIDQHAAHEKVLFEKIMSAAKEKTNESQLLLPPIVLTLNMREQEVIQKYEDVLKSLGYEIEHFGGNEYSVRAVPSDFYGLSEKDLLLEFIDDLTDDFVGSTPNSILERVASLSCKSAVKANHTFSLAEATALIKELLTLENPYHCPHGRPVIISMSQYELEKKFKRIL